MIDSFPFDEWAEDIGAFWTFGPQNSTGTYVLTVLGIIAMVVSLIGWVWLEDQKLKRQASHLRSAGGGPGPAAGGTTSEPTSDSTI
jgi:hypothetical protein